MSDVSVSDKIGTNAENKIENLEVTRRSHRQSDVSRPVGSKQEMWRSRTCSERDRPGQMNVIRQNPPKKKPEGYHRIGRE